MIGPDVQREARALGYPTRHRLYRYIVDAARPVGVGELTDYEQLNHNAVAVLKDAGLVTEEVEDRTARAALACCTACTPKSSAAGARLAPTPGWPAS